MADRGVVFDFGGVIITPITNQLGEVARRHGTDVVTMLEVLMGPRTTSTADHPWHRAERGELATADIQAALGPWAARAGLELHGDEIEALLAPGGYTVNGHVLEAIAALRERGVALALLTNSLREFRPVLERDVDLSLFDAVIDSSEVGHRKPEPAIYRLTTERLGVVPASTAYLDDFDHNLAPAIELGWRAIHVTDTRAALAELDAWLDLVTEPEEGP